jgi:predicted nucleotidyltransferase
VARAVRALRLLRRLGVTAGVVGSLADGRFSEHSDVDFMVLQCPRPLKYAIEGRVEDVMRDIAFDVIYREEASGSIARYPGRCVLDADALIKSAA